MRKYLSGLAFIAVLITSFAVYSFYAYFTKYVYEKDLTYIFTQHNVAVNKMHCNQIGSFRVAECKFNVDVQGIVKNSGNLKLNEVGFTEENILYPSIYGNPETRLKVGEKSYCDIGQQSDPRNFTYYDAKWQEGNITTKGKGPEPLTYTNSFMIINKTTGNACMLLFIAFG